MDNGERYDTSAKPPHTNPRKPPTLSRLEHAERKKLMHQLVLNHVPFDSITQTFRNRYQTSVSVAAIRRLKDLVERELIDMDRELIPLLKQKQVSRLHEHIIKAKAANSWNAVVSAERLLAQIQGTLVPLQINVNVEATVRESVAHVLGGFSKAQLMALLTTGDLPGTRPGELVLTTGYDATVPAPVEPEEGDG
jgi:hypothetical protein